MKKLIWLSILMLLNASVFSQKIIDNPKFSTSTAPYVSITKIALYDTVTILDFEVNYYPKMWISVSSEETYIQSSKGGEKLFVTRAEGIVLNEKHWTPENGMNTYTLFFPALDKSVETIDFLEQKWKIFDIEIKKQQSISLIPENLQGNWLRTDGSNEWVYGILENKIIYDSKIWNNIFLTKKGKSYQIIMENNGVQESLLIKLKKKGLLIGRGDDRLELFSENLTKDLNYTLSNDQPFEPPVFNYDTAIFKGYLNGYHPSMGTTGIVYVNDILYQEQNSYLMSIEPDGSFYAEFPMLHPHEVYVRLFNMNEQIYFEPGEETFMYIDLKHNYIRQKPTHLFMGKNARINAELQALDSIRYFDYQEVQKIILDMTAENFKAYCLDLMDKELEAFKKFQEDNVLSKKAVQIKSMQIPYRKSQEILSYSMYKSSVYRKKHNIPRDQREIPMEKEELDPAFYDFINSEDLNNPVSLVCGGDYNHLINRIQYSESTRPKFNYAYLDLMDSITMNNIEITENERRILTELISCKNMSSLRETINKDTAILRPFLIKHKDLYASVTRREAYMEKVNKNLELYFGLSEGLATEIMYSQTQSSKLKGLQKPFDEEEKKSITEAVTNAFIIEYLFHKSDALEKEIEEKLSANKEKTGYVINETPKTEGDKIFDAILEKYKGKVVFVDFWATWCSPCRSGIERIKPLKEEMKDEDIEFIYITNQSSPTDTWNMMIPDIKGEHYRLETDEWNTIATRFKISGIPHYTLVDKNGVVVKEKLHFTSSNAELKELFKEFLVK